MTGDPRLQYVIRQFERIFQVRLENLPFSIGDQPRKKVHLKTGNWSYFDNIHRLESEDFSWKNYEGTRLPFFLSRYSDEIFSEDEQGIIIHQDVLLCAFYFLSGWQEKVRPERDELNRFFFPASIQHELNIAELPVVDYYFRILADALSKATGQELRPRQPENQSFTVFLSHDIDFCSTGWKQEGLHGLKQGNPLVPFQMVMKHLFGKDPYDNFDELLAWEKANGVPATYFFLCRRGEYRGYYNADYDISEPRLRRALEQITREGGEVGIHGSFQTHFDSKRFAEDLKLLDYPVTGNRFHFLMWEWDKSVAVLEENGMKYDASLGFARNIGFRNSTSYPFYIWDLAKEKETDILEIPMHIMDASLWDPRHMNLNPRQAIEASIPMIEEVHRSGGVLSLLWHNNYYSKHKYPGWDQVLYRLIDICKEKGAGFMNGQQVREQWK